MRQLNNTMQWALGCS